MTDEHQQIGDALTEFFDDPDVADHVQFTFTAAEWLRRLNVEIEACAEVAKEYGERYGSGENKDDWTITHTNAGVQICIDIRARKRGV